MIRCTLNQYKENFKTNLLVFLNEYEDNTKFFFLQNEKTKYQAYQKALTKIADQMKLFTREELNQNLVHRNIASDLKKIDHNIYNSIITELNPVQDEAIISLSAAKKDRIKINEIELEKHIKSSIVILKFISEEFDIPFDLKANGLPIEYELEQIDNKLWEWLKNYETTNEYISIPMVIEEKTDYIIDTYKNYEERNFKYQLEICNIILEKEPSEEIIFKHKNEYEKKLINLRKQYPIPNTNIVTIISDINNAFYRLEKFMDGTVQNYKSFLFNDAFTIFFNELNKLENVNVKNHKLRDGYHYFLSQLSYAYDKVEFKNQKAYKNDDFNRDFNELEYVYNHRSSEFGINFDLDDYKFEMPSIMEIVNDAINQNLDLKVETTNKISSSDKKLLTPDKYNYKSLLEKSGNYFENLINDPLFSTQNEYMNLKKTFIEDVHSTTAHLKEPYDYFLQEFDGDLQEWEKTQKEEINKSFLKLIKELNQNKIFFFGCTFDNYKHNYNKRLNEFLEFYADSTEYDFIEDELKFLENILYDIQNSENAHNGYPQSGYDEFSKAYEFVSITGYKQYFFSHNKKETFLNKRMFELTSEEKVKDIDTLNNHINTDKDQTNIIEIKKNNSNIFVQIKEKKPAEKWYALLYLLELQATNTKPPTNYEGDFIRKDMEEIGKKRTGTTGQSFYRECLKINEIINNNSLLEKSFNKDWKQKIIDISNNDELIIYHLKNNY